jgi:predicted RNA binding protein YcfA (HicA-like mRNA interferase family)
MGTSGRSGTRAAGSTTRTPSTADGLRGAQADASISSDGNEELFEAVDAYFVGPGHTPIRDGGTEVVEFCPSKVPGRTMEVVTGNMECRFARIAQALVRTASYPRSVSKKYREVRKALRAAGWQRVRQAGSHQTWQSRDGSRAVTVAGTDADTVPVGTPAAIRRATGMKDLR